jgi:Fe-S-cluster-containing dehydrogenase component
VESVQENGNMLSMFEPCMHCDEPACVEACPLDAISKNADGIVLVDYNKCKGDGSCIDACPYGKPYIRMFSSPSAPARRADKCTFCVEFVKKGELPICVRTCQGHALYFGDLLDANSEISSILNKERHRTCVLDRKNGKFLKITERKKTSTKPNVYYLT